jgi:hypothetical protein
MNTTKIGAMKKLLAVLLILPAMFVFASCSGDSNADKVGENLGKEAEKFNVQRSIIFVNAITDQVLYEVEGRCSVEGNPNLPRNLEVICKHGPDNYKKHFLGLSDNVTWIATQQEGIDVSEYRTKIIFRPESIVPDLDLVTGD